MKMKYIIIGAIVLLSLTTVDAGWFGYDNGECEIFQITPPEGYHNAGELTYNESLFLSTTVTEYPYHSLHVAELTKEEYENNTNNIIESNETYKILKDYKEDNIRIIESQNQRYDDYNEKTILEYNATTAFISKDGHYYVVGIGHKECSFDEKEFDNDTKIIKNIYDSLRRK